VPEKMQAEWIDFDHRDDESALDPHGRWKKMRDDAPLNYSERYDGFYVVSRYADMCAIARDSTLFSTVLRRTTIPLRATPPSPPLNADPPEHGKYRRILNPYFSPATVASYEPWIREIAADIIDPLTAQYAFDVPADLGMPLARAVILRILGMEKPPPELSNWVDDLIIVGGEPGEHAAVMLLEFLRDEIAKRQLSPGDDVLSSMLTSEFDGRRLRIDDEVLPMTVLLVIAGLETTASAIAACVFYLLEHPEERTRLMNDPDIWDLAMDELLRWATPAPAQSRALRSDAEVQGCPMHAGDRVMLLYGSGNRDEREFPDPDSVILDRHPNRHLAFGIGPHRCIGSHLAKTEMKIALEMLLPHLEEWRVSDPSDIVWKAAENRGLAHLPIVRSFKASPDPELVE
jgi:cytochrome P450